jgi:uncharacterized Zn finger protein
MPRRGGWYGDYDYFPVSKPRQVKDGIKTKKEHGAIGETWWSKRWLKVLESFGMGARLTRGRSYARQGQVVSIEIVPGQVKAKVQGSQVRPYKVEIKLEPLSTAQWDKVIEAMSEQAIFAAKLLAGEMPQDIEEAFASAKVSLMPASSNELETDCSCPDWSNPCKHIAAVYYILADQFDSDPFLIFKLRGRSKEEIIAALREKRAADLPEETALAIVEKVEVGIEPLEPAPRLAESLENFWEAGEELAEFGARPALPEVENAILMRLGELPFKLNSGGQEVSTLLAKAYMVASRVTLQKASES